MAGIVADGFGAGTGDADVLGNDTAMETSLTVGGH